MTIKTQAITYRSAQFFIALLSFLLIAGFAKHTYAVPRINQDHFKPVMVYVTGQMESERAFIDMARKGATKARKELSIQVDEFRIPEDRDTTAFLKELAEKGYSPILAVGYQNVVPVLNLAEQYPATIFTVIDGLVPPVYQNVQSIVFKDHEGAFLVGMIAAYTSKNDKVGFVGGMDVPLIRNFGYGYEQGAKFVRPNIVVYQNMVGNTAAAWGMPDTANEIAKGQFKKGADVVFAAAGGSSIGVLEAAKQEGKLAIGVDTNQNGLFPGHVLTSLVKRVDVAVYNSLVSAHDKKWSAGIKSLGLKESALDFSVDDNNKTLLTNDIIQQVLITRERIINGIIDVETYSPE